MNAKINDFIPLLRFISLINSKTIEQFINRRLRNSQNEFLAISAVSISRHREGINNAENIVTEMKQICMYSLQLYCHENLIRKDNCNSDISKIPQPSCRNLFQVKFLFFLQLVPFFLLCIAFLDSSLASIFSNQ